VSTVAAPPAPTPPVPERGGQPSLRVPGRFYPGADHNRLHVLLVASGMLGRLPTLAVYGLVALWAGLAGFAAGALTEPTAGAQIAITMLAAALLCDAIVLVSLPRRRISFGPLAPQLLLLAALRGLAALGLSALVALLALGVARWLGAPFGAAMHDLAWLGVFLNLIVQTVGCALTVRGFVVEPGRLGVTHLSARSPRLPGRLRVMQIGDLHVERRSVREDQLQRAIEHFQPDMLLFTGDFLNLSNVEDRTAWAEVRAVLREWRAPHGIFAVSGSPLVDPPEVVAQLLDGLPITWLRNQTVIAGPPESPVRLVGVTCTHVPEDDALTLAAVLDGAPGRNLFTVLLYHSPDLAPEAARLGIDLQLSGHTHGGQVRLPLHGALLTSSLHGKRFEMGRYRLENLQLYVARGVGLEGQGAPRARFRCPPEVVLWEWWSGETSWE
jgi:predicted MPP superfamily phosphohydrolase